MMTIRVNVAANCAITTKNEKEKKRLNGCGTKFTHRTNAKLITRTMHTKSKILLKTNSNKNKAKHVGKQMDKPAMQPYTRE
ncbi:hypothetical protein Lal_00034050 [Lupinus albus]|nr:hypothetical protein Lal_00034050 [Lupinus albus]